MIIFLLCRISWPRGAEGFTVAEAADVCWWGKKKKRTEKMKYTHGPELRRRCMAAWPPAISLSLPFSPFKRTRYLPSKTIIANGAIKLRLVIKFQHFKQKI